MQHRARNALIVVGILAATVIAARAALPYGMKRYVNAQLAAMGEYTGSVSDVDIALLRGAYVLHAVTIEKAAAQVPEPFMVMDHMDISVQWRALLDARLVGELVMHAPVLNMVQGETADDTQLGAGVNWPAEIRELFPFRFNRVEVVDGTVTFRAPGIDAEESLTVRDARLLLHNLTNVQDENEDAFADLEFAGAVMGNAPLTLTGRFDPNTELPTFDVNLALEEARLVDVNPWLDEFLNVDAEQGTFSMYTELAAAEGRFAGYIRPIMREPRIFNPDESAEGPFRKAWEALVHVAAQLFRNRETDAVATQIPFSGELEDPEVGVLPAMINVLRNAFVAAFSYSIEGSVSLRTVDPDADEDPSPSRD